MPPWTTFPAACPSSACEPRPTLSKPSCRADIQCRGMSGFLLARAVFVGVVVYAATVIRPLDGFAPSVARGLGVALLGAAAEARLRDASGTIVLGGLLGLRHGLLRRPPRASARLLAQR